MAAGVRLAVAESTASLLSYLPIYFLASVASEHQIGVFAGAMYAVTFANMFYSSVQQVWLAPLSVAHREGRLGPAARRPILFLLSLGVLGSLATQFVLPVLLPVLYGPEFMLDRIEILPLSIAILALSASYGAGLLLMALNRYQRQLYVALSALAFTGASVLLVPSQNPIIAAGVLVAISALMRSVAGVIGLVIPSPGGRRA